MAIGGISSTGGGNKKYPGKLTHFVLRSCLVASMGGLIFGYDIGISGGVASMHPFLEKFFPSVANKENLNETTNKYCQYNSQMLTLFTSSLYLAALLSSLAASTVSRKFGRQRSMLFGGLLFFAGGLFNFIAQHVWMLIVGRVLLGFGVGFANQAVPLYLSEMAPSKYRGCLNIGFQLLITFGIVFANVLNFFFGKITSDWGWRSSLGGAMIPALVIIIGSLWLPDTPHSMIDLVGGVQMIISQIVVAAAIWAKFGTDGSPGDLPQWYAILAVFFVCIYIAGFAWSWGPLGWLVPSEIFPSEIRSAGQSVTVSCNMFFTFVVAQCFLTMLCHMKFGLFIFFAAFVVAMTIFVYFMLPETKGISIDEMGSVWRSHSYWSRFVEHNDNNGVEMDQQIPPVHTH